MLKTLLLAALLLPAAAAGQSNDTSDMERYIGQIRKDRMSEEAKVWLRTVAHIRTGHSLLVFAKDSGSGSYTKTLMATYCPLPGADRSEVQKAQSIIDDDIDREVAKIRPLADFDHSGFVTTEEADRFDRLIEFGLLADFAARQGEPEDAIARLAEIPREKLSDLIDGYKTMVHNANDLGVGNLPAWPYGD